MTGGESGAADRLMATLCLAALAGLIGLAVALAVMLLATS